MRTAIIVVAAGLGTRLGADRPKALVELDGRALLSWALQHAAATAGVERIVVVAPEGHVAQSERAAREGLAAAARQDLSLVLVTGGAERHDSVANGLVAVGDDIDCVLVHDAARCLAPVEVFDAVVAAVAAGDAAVVPGLSVTDTIKRVDAKGLVVDTPPRAALRAVQTPQGFRPEVLRQAHAGDTSALGVTDDAGLVEHLGLRVRVVPGHADAEKVTTPADLVRAHRRLEEQSQ